MSRLVVAVLVVSCSLVAATAGCALRFRPASVVIDGGDDHHHKHQKYKKAKKYKKHKNR